MKVVRERCKALPQLEVRRPENQDRRPRAGVGFLGRAVGFLGRPPLHQLDGLGERYLAYCLFHLCQSQSQDDRDSIFNDGKVRSNQLPIHLSNISSAAFVVSVPARNSTRTW